MCVEGQAAFLTTPTSTARPPAAPRCRTSWSGLRLKLKAENLLNSEYRWEQEANGVTQIQRSYHTGRTFGISVSYGR